MAAKVYIAGHRGMVGSAIWRKLARDTRYHLIGKTSAELDLRDQDAVKSFISRERPDIVVDAAARVGGILANSTYPYQFLMDNLMIQNNLLSASHQSGVSRFVFLGSSCIYPKNAPQPLKEEYMLTGALEPTNQWYAIAKIAGVKAVEALRQQYGADYVSLMPTNLYGPFDNFDLQTSHVLPALIRKFHEARVNGHTPVTLWGSGNPLREFLHVDDLATAVAFVLERSMPEHLYNVGVGHDLPIRDLAALVQRIVGHQGQILWDSSKPDGTPRKLMDVSKLAAMGWQHSISLEHGLADTYQWFLEHRHELKEVKVE
ncbi:MAG: GDP-L-fucose synthase family protein [Cyclobacteriaceae bacterium]